MAVKGGKSSFYEDAKQKKSLSLLMTDFFLYGKTLFENKASI